MPDAIICHHVSQDRGCLSSNIMGILWGTFKLKGLGAREGFLPPCVVLWEWVGSSWPGGCWAWFRLGGKLAVFKLKGRSLTFCLCLSSFQGWAPALALSAHLLITYIHPTFPNSGTCLCLGPACSFQQDLCKLAVFSAWSLLKLQLSPAGWFLCFSHPTRVKSWPDHGLQRGVGTADLSGSSVCSFWATGSKKWKDLFGN